MFRYEEIRVNSELQQKLRASMEIRRLMREWFYAHDFFEVETPSLVRTPGQEPYLYPFETIVRDERGRETSGYLITSPEYALKKLLAAGFSRVFEFSRVFRNNEPADALHNPEFTMLEWYRADTDYRGIMEDVEQLVNFVANQLSVTLTPPSPLEGEGKGRGGIDFKPPWERVSVREAFKKYAEVDLDTELGRENFDEWFFKIFLTTIEPKLGLHKPTILYDYPASMAALAVIKKDDPRYAERFEIYMHGIEIANAFTELGDSAQQRRRFIEEQKIRVSLGKPVHPLDEEFLAALGSGFPKAGGIAIGVDRLAMVLLDAKSIREVLYFPWIMGTE